MSQRSDIKSVTSSDVFTRKRKPIELVTVCQVAAIFVVIIACVVNLSVGEDKAVLWSSLLSGSLGYLLPAPKVRRNGRVLSDVAVEQQHGRVSGKYADALCDQIAFADLTDGGLGSSASRNEHAAVMVYDSGEA